MAADHGLTVFVRPDSSYLLDTSVEPDPVGPWLGRLTGHQVEGWLGTRPALALGVGREVAVELPVIRDHAHARQDPEGYQEFLA